MRNPKWKLLCLSVFSIFAASLFAAAQDETPPQPDMVYVCVDLEIGEPYLVAFRDADMTQHTIGFVVPENATITVYSPETKTAGVGVYSILPDALTGGYRRDGEITTAYTRNDIPSDDRPCSVQYPTIILEALLATIPIPVSQNQAVVIQFGGDDLLDTKEFSGVFTFHFRPLTTQVYEDFQIIQMSGGGIEVSFPSLAEDTRFVLIANKEVRLRISFDQVPGNFLAQVIANPTDGFAQSLARERIIGDEDAETSETLNLSQIMEEGAVRIYPAFGVVLTYPTGGFLRLEMSPVAALRGAFNQEGNAPVFVRAIQGLEAAYYIVNNPDTPYATLTNPPDASAPPKTLELARIDDQGRLIVKTQGGDAFIESWYVEVAPG